jgi:hypothetical protein
MGHAINGNDEIALLLFSGWQRLDRQAQDILTQSNDDLSDSAYVEAEKRSVEALWRFLGRPTPSIQIIALKLQIACQFEDFCQEAIDPANNRVTPRAVLSALLDLRNLELTGAEENSRSCAEGVIT